MSSWVGFLERRATRPEGTPDRRFFFAVLATAYILFCATYLPMNAFSVGRDAHILFLPGEDRIPFVPEFEYVYVSGYVLPVMAVWKIPDVRRFLQLLPAFLMTLAVACTTYLLFPVYLERPVFEVDSLATFLVSIEYLDHSYNHFPSLHVALSWLIYYACRDEGRRRTLFRWFVVGISISTIFIKQHYIVDVAYGFVLATGAWALAGRWVESRASRATRRAAAEVAA